MRTNSLAFRLTTTAAGAAIVLFLVAALVLTELFQQAVQRNFDTRLRAVLEGLQGNIELSENGQPVVKGALVDSRFALPDSGWYWQVQPLDQTNIGAASGSLGSRSFGERWPPVLAAGTALPAHASRSPPAATAPPPPTATKH